MGRPRTRLVRAIWVFGLGLHSMSHTNKPERDPTPCCAAQPSSIVGETCHTGPLFSSDCLNRKKMWRVVWWS